MQCNSRKVLSSTPVRSCRSMPRIIWDQNFDYNPPKHVPLSNGKNINYSTMSSFKAIKILHLGFENPNIKTSVLSVIVRTSTIVPTFRIHFLLCVQKSERLKSLELKKSQDLCKKKPLRRKE